MDHAVEEWEQRTNALLRAVFGLEALRPAQRPVVQRVLGGGNALVVMPTGGGKSLCYQAPAILRPGVGLVVSPLISLMQDQVAALRQYGVRAAFLNSSLSPREQRQAEADLRAGRLDLLYVAPERLLTGSFLDLIAGVPLALIAIDEAHCISQWGHDFRPEYSQLGEVRRRFPDAPCIATTATADAPTRRDIAQQLQLAPEDIYVSGFNRPNIRYEVAVKSNVKQQLLRFIEGEHRGHAGIVYCLSRKRTEEVGAWLAEQGVRTAIYHAGMPSAARRQTLERFRQEEGLVVVATVAFGMGIDKPNVRFVAHVDAPRSPEAYYQETGRAGRDGLPATAWMAYGVADVVAMRRMIEESVSEGDHKWIERHKLNAITGYCETAECRRAVLLKYFGERLDAPCGNCDNCLNPVETWNGTVAAQKVLSCVVRTGQRFGATHIVDVLRGNPSERVHQRRHHQLPTFGVGKDLSETEWRSVIRQLVASDVLRVDLHAYGALQCRPEAAPILKGEQTVLLRRDPRPPSRKKRRASAAAGAPTAAEAALFERLRARRLELAREQGMPPYIILLDSTLLAMAQRRPRTPAELAEIPGFGKVKLERYGAAFLEVLSEQG